MDASAEVVRDTLYGQRRIWKSCRPIRCPGDRTIRLVRVCGEGQVVDLVLLPATEPDDETYGFTPDRIEAFPDVSVRQIRFPRMVWYNATIRQETVTQIRDLGVSSIVLAGFSKSGLGVWNVAQMVSDLISGMILFDAPMVLTEPPMRVPNEYYEDAAAWQQDSPARSVGNFKTVMPRTSRLVMISGESFHEDMVTFAEVLSSTAIDHTFFQRPEMKHHWASGWLEEGIRALLAKQ